MLLDDEGPAGPSDWRHSCAEVAVKLAPISAHSTSAGTAISTSHASSTVARMLSGEENRRVRSQCQTPTWPDGGGSASPGYA